MLRSLIFAGSCKSFARVWPGAPWAPSRGSAVAGAKAVGRVQVVSMLAGVR